MRVGELSRRTGVGVSTLRAWERRFGLLEPERSESGQRLYTETDVDRVAAVGRLLTEGLTVSAAATRVASTGPGALSATQREAFLLHQAVQAAGEGIWVSQDGMTRIANRRMAELMHCSLDELMDRPVMDFVDPASLEVAAQHLDRVRAGHRQRYELCLLRGDGTTFVADVNATPLRDSAGAYNGAVAVIADVSARAESEEDARFRTAALDAIGEAVVAADIDATIRYINPAAERLLGWRATEFVGQNGLAVLPAPDSSAEAQQFYAGLLEGRRQTGDMDIARRDGSEFRANATGTPILDGSGEMVGLIAVIRDDSERVRLEEDLRAQEQQAEVVAMLGARVLGNGAQDRELILTEAVEACRRAFGADLAAVLDVTSATDDLVVRITSPPRGEPIVIPGGSRSIAGYTALAGKVVIVEDAARDRRFDRPPTPPWRGPLMSAVAAPVHGPDGVRGVLLVGLTRTHTFGPSAGHFVQSVANIVGMALQH